MTARPPCAGPVIPPTRPKPSSARRRKDEAVRDLTAVTQYNLEPAPTLRMPRVHVPDTTDPRRKPPHSPRAGRLGPMRQHGSPAADRAGGKPGSPRPLNLNGGSASSARLLGAAGAHGIGGSRPTVLTASELEDIVAEYDSMRRLDDSLPQTGPKETDPATITEKLNEMHRAMHKFQTVAEIALLNMGARGNEQTGADGGIRGSEEGRKWIAQQAIDDHTGQIVGLLEDVANQNSALMSFIDAVAGEDEERPLSLKASGIVSPRGPARRKSTATGSLALSPDSSPKLASSPRGGRRGFRRQRSNFSESNLFSSGVIEEFEVADTDAVLSSPCGAAESNADLVHADTAELHSALLKVHTLTGASHEQTLRRGDVNIALPGYFSTLRKAVSGAMVELQRVTASLHATTHDLAAAEARIEALESKESRNSVLLAKEEHEQTVVTCEIVQWAIVVSHVGEDEASAARQMLESLALRTAAASGGSLVASHGPAFAASFPSAVAGVAWAQMLQRYVCTLPWQQALQALPECAPEVRGVLAQSELRSLKQAADARATTSKGGQRVAAIKESFLSTIVAIPAVQQAFRSGELGLPPELDHAAESLGRTPVAVGSAAFPSPTNANMSEFEKDVRAGVEECATVHSRRGLRLRIGIHYTSLRDLRSIQEHPLNMARHVSAVLAALAKPTEIVVTPATITAVNSATSQAGGPAAVLSSTISELGTVAPYEALLDACLIPIAMRIESICHPVNGTTKPAAAAFIPPPVMGKFAFEPLSWLVAPFAPSHAAAVEAMHPLLRTIATANVGLQSEPQFDGTGTPRVSLKRRQSTAHGVLKRGKSMKKPGTATSNPAPLASSAAAEPGSPDPFGISVDVAHTPTDSSRKGRSRNTNNVSSSNLGRSESPGSPLGFLSATSEASILRPATVDVSTQAGTDTVVLTNARVGTSMNRQSAASIANDALALLCAAIGRAEGTVSRQELNQTVATFVSGAPPPSAEQETFTPGASSTRHVFSSGAVTGFSVRGHGPPPLPPPAWAVAWARLERRLLAYLPTAGNRHAMPVPVSAEVVCRDVIAIAVSLADESLQLLQSPAGKKRYGETMADRLAETLSEKGAILKALVPLARGPSSGHVSMRGAAHVAIGSRRASRASRGSLAGTPKEAGLDASTTAGPPPLHVVV